MGSVLLAALLCVSATLPPQDDISLLSTPFDQVVELELAEDDEALIDGRGPTAVVDYEVRFDGWLHVWAESELDLFLQLDDVRAFETLTSDDDSGGGTTPYVSLPVRNGTRIALLVAGHPGDAGEFTLLVRSALEPLEVRIAAAELFSSVAEAERLTDEGERDGAREVVDRAMRKLQITDGAADSRLITDMLFGLGGVAFDLGDLASSRAAYEMVLVHRESRRPEDHPDLANARGNLALSLHPMGELARARELREAVLASCERTLPEDDAKLTRSRANLAISMHVMGDLAGARALREAVVAARERTLPEHHPDLLHARGSLATSVHAMGDLAGARALRESVVAGYERTLSPDHASLQYARIQLATSMHDMGNLEGARALRGAVVDNFERTLPEGHPDLLSARQNLANSMQALGELTGALELREAVLAARLRALPEDHPDLWRARASMAVSMEALGDPHGALVLRKAVLAACERTLPEHHRDHLLSRGSLLASYRATGDLDEARALVPSLADGMRARALEALALAPREALEAVARERGRLSGVFFSSESGGAPLDRVVFELSETLRLVAGEAARSLSRFESDPELAPLLAEAASVRSALNDLVGGGARPERNREAVAEELTRLTLVRDAAERQASRRLAERGVVTRSVDAESLAAALEPGDVAVGYRRLLPWNGEARGGRVVAHVLTSAGELSRVDLGPATEIEGLAVAWRASLGAPLSDASRSPSGGQRGLGFVVGVGDNAEGAGRRLRERVLDPVMAAAGESAKRLFLCPDDVLFLVPFDALPDGERRVGDRLGIVSEVSFARFLSESVALEAEASLLALGGVDYGDADAETEGARRSALLGSFVPLPESRREAESIATLFGTALAKEAALLTGASTTKAALFEAAPGTCYVHVATHGWFAPESVKSIADASPADPTRMTLEQRITGLAPMTLCGLALAGANNGRDSLGRVPGILTAEELCSLDLSQCELAVLSACETNVGIRRAGQGIQSLQAALYAAGARTSITSLWKVDDAATRRLFEVFYTNLWVAKMPKAEALWRAKVTLREEGHPPRDWAGWVLTGDPD
jgi:CHAT domain-containing protein